MKKAAVYIGTWGWYYDQWEGILYPPGLAKAKRFEIYVNNFNAVVINATFYRLPCHQMVNGWYKKVPEGFMLAVKAHKEITHKSKLKNVNQILDRFLKAVSPLEDKLGVILFQLRHHLNRIITF